MFTETITKIAVAPTLKTTDPPYPVTPTSLTMALAYCHYYTPKRLGRGRLIALKHLRTIAGWIGAPRPQLRSWRQHLPLALHMALLQATGFLASSGPILTPQPAVTPWLHMPFPDNIAPLLQAIASPDRWQNALSSLGLQNRITGDVTVYLQQSLTRQCQACPPENHQTVCWLPADAGAWQLLIPASLPNWLHFDLRQLGEWAPNEPLTCTPFTIATAVQRGYGRDLIRWILETATGRPLPPSPQIQLNQWSRRAHTYHLRTVHLLSTTQPQQMKTLMRQKRLRDAAIEQISPRHAIVTEGMRQYLETWLGKRGYPLRQHRQQTGKKTSAGESIAYQWLGARLLIGLGHLIPLPCPPPHSLLALLSTQLDEAEKTTLEATAVKILQNLRQAIHGRP